MLVELKNGETLNGHLVNCDSFMNLTLKEVVQTSADGERFLQDGGGICQGKQCMHWITQIHPLVDASVGRQADRGGFCQPRSSISGYRMRSSRLHARNRLRIMRTVIEDEEGREAVGRLDEEGLRQGRWEEGVISVKEVVATEVVVEAVEGSAEDEEEEGGSRLVMISVHQHQTLLDPRLEDHGNLRTRRRKGNSHCSEELFILNSCL